jgi:uncharacterized protein YqjF (DUF2071 family)
MYQRWRSLLFLHFACPPGEVQKLLPDGLTVDTFPDADGKEAAWIGFVPFRMEGVRPRGFPAVRALSDFPEANVRTYVHHEGRNPGVWFFSLDASQPLACEYARNRFGLPYYYADMAVEEHGDFRRYTHRRIWGQGASFVVQATFEQARPPAEPGTLEFFLVERYLLYAIRRGRLLSGRVFHTPYPLREVDQFTEIESIVRASASFLPQPYTHSIASDGVDVEVFRLARVR